MTTQAAGTVSDAAALEAALTPETPAGGTGGGAAAAKPAEGAGGTGAAAGKPAAGAEGSGGGAADDPEVDLSQIGFGKVKKSELEAWKKSQMQESDYRKKTEELSSREAEVKELIELSNVLAKNPKKLARVLEIVDEADDVLEAAQAGSKGGPSNQQIEAEQAKLQAMIDKLDPEDPASMLLKTIYMELQATKGVVFDFQKRAQQQAQQEQQNAAADAMRFAQNVMVKTMTGLEKELKFASDEEKGPWRDMTIQLLRKTKGIKNQEDFVKAINEAGQTVFNKLRAIADASLKKHLEESGKGPKLPGQGAGGAGASAKEQEMTMENLQENLEAEFQKIADSKK